MEYEVVKCVDCGWHGNVVRGKILSVKCPSCGKIIKIKKSKR